MLKSSRLRQITWCVVLGLIAVSSGIFIIQAFHPGGFNGDLVFQLRQARGQIPFNDWHPVVQSLVWKWLIELTGDFSSLLTAQVAIFELAAFGLSLYIYLVTRKPLMSLLGFAVLFAPWVLTFAGMLWKDSEMAACLFLVVVLGLYISRYTWLKWPFLVIAIIFLVYATMVRKNAVFAVLPLVWYLWCQVAAGTRLAPYAGRLLRRPLRRLSSLPKRRFAGLFAVSIVFAGLVLGGSAGVDAMTKPERTDQVTQIYLDDLSFTLTDEQIESEPMPESLRDDLRGIRATCPLDGSRVVSNVYWRCYRKDGPQVSYHAIDDADAIERLWVKEVTAHPVDYLRYRTLVYEHFLFDTNFQFDAEPVGLPAEVAKTNPIQNQMLQVYIQKFGMSSLGWTFQTWFWFAAVIVGCVFSVRMRHFRRLAVCLSASSLIYMVGYFPIVPAYNFRYAYWPAVAMTIVGALALVAWRWERTLRLRGHAWTAHRSAHRIHRRLPASTNGIAKIDESGAGTERQSSPVEDDAGHSEEHAAAVDSQAELSEPAKQSAGSHSSKSESSEDLGDANGSGDEAEAARHTVRKPMRLSLNRRDDD